VKTDKGEFMTQPIHRAKD